MFSYLVVVALVLGPMLIYLHTSLDASLYEAASQQIKRAGALGLSAAFLLSLLAALAVSRPLRNIASAARAFAAGDFGHPVDIESRDELGDAADALRHLAVQLRAVLVEVGSSRATIHALLDDLPCGVILYDERLQPIVVSARAREQCDLVGADEHGRAEDIARLAAQERARRDASAQGRTIAVPLELPWSPERVLEARWINVYSKEGRREQALVIVDQDVERTHETVTKALNGSVLLLREAARAVPAEELRLQLEVEADRLERWASWHEEAQGPVTSVLVGELCELAAQQIEARIEMKKIKLKFELPEGRTHVAESDGRTCRAVRSFLESAVKTSKKGSNLAITGEIQNGCVRLTVRTKGLETHLDEVEPLASIAGGQVGAERLGDVNVVWLTIPRA